MKIIHTADWHIGKLVHGLHVPELKERIDAQFEVRVTTSGSTT